MECKDLRKRLDFLMSNRKVVEQQWELVRQYVVPYRGQFFNDKPGEGGVDWRENRSVFDSTAINANNILASSLHGAITNPAIQWFDFRFRNDEFNQNKEASQWLHDTAQITFETLRDSNFNLEANEGYIDLTSMGSACITREVLEDNGDFEDFLFQAVPIEEAYFEQDYRGRICKFYRKMNWTAVQVMSKFGDKVPDTIKEKARKSPGDMDVTVVFAIYKREGKYDSSKIAAPDKREFGYKYFLYEDGTQLGDEGGYYSMPAHIMRWRKTSDSMWGNSPAMIALPDILTLNELVALILQSLEKVVDPALKTTERGLLSDLDLGPAGINVVRDMSDLEAFESKARFDVAELNREKLQSSIRSIFYVDQLELKDSPAMTATEVQVRYELMQRLLGPTLGRLESDFLDPLVSGVFADLWRYKKLPPAPSIFAEGGDPTINIEYTGSMARAQQMERAQTLLGMIGSVAQLSEVQPKVLDKIDWDTAVDLIAEYHQVEPKILVSTNALKAKRKKDDQDTQRMQDAAVQQQEGAAANEIAQMEAVR